MTKLITATRWCKRCNRSAPILYWLDTKLFALGLLRKAHATACYAPPPLISEFLYVPKCEPTHSMWVRPHWLQCQDSKNIIRTPIPTDFTIFQTVIHQSDEQYNVRIALVYREQAVSELSVSYL